MKALRAGVPIAYGVTASGDSGNTCPPSTAIA
jgi:hypothetical protein